MNEIDLWKTKELMEKCKNFPSNLSFLLFFQKIRNGGERWCGEEEENQR